MKHFLLILFLLPTFLSAQEYSEVVQAQGETSDALYVKAREWFAITFNSANNVLQMDDPIAGKLIGKGAFHVSESYVSGNGLMAVPITIEWRPNFTIAVSIRDGRYKYDITDITIKTVVPGFNPPIIEQPFSTYLDNLEYTKNASDPEWIINNPPQGVKVKKGAARSTALANSAIYNLTTKTTAKIEALIHELKTAMLKNTNNDW